MPVEEERAGRPDSLLAGARLVGRVVEADARVEVAAPSVGQIDARTDRAVLPGDGRTALLRHRARGKNAQGPGENDTAARAILHASSFLSRGGPRSREPPRLREMRDGAGRKRPASFLWDRR